MPMAAAWLAVIVIGGLSGLVALCLCWFLIGFGGQDSAEKHGISDTLSSRLGGVVIVFYLLFNAAYLWSFAGYSLSSLEGAVLTFVTIFFLMGLVEDITSKLTARIRFSLMVLASLGLMWFVSDLRLADVGIAWVDWILELSTVASIAFSALCLAFLPNAFNTADGANGLVGGIGLTVLAALALMTTNSLGVLQASGAVGCLVFLVFNLYTGRFFLGDGGAYAIGVLVGTSLIVVANSTNVSAWFLLALIFYPAADLIWSMARRIVGRRPVFEPDEEHLHNLIFYWISRQVSSKKLANNLTGLTIVTVFCLFPVILAWSDVISLDGALWSYIVVALWLLYAISWFILRKYDGGKADGFFGR